MLMSLFCVLHPLPESGLLDGRIRIHRQPFRPSFKAKSVKVSLEVVGRLFQALTKDEDADTLISCDFATWSGKMWNITETRSRFDLTLERSASSGSRSF